MANARCVLTDSGGIQEETTALGVPCLTLRHNTERPVTVSRGTNRVVGTDADAIYRHWREVGRRTLAGWRAARVVGWQGGRAHRPRAAWRWRDRNALMDVRPLTTETVDWDAFVRSTPRGQSVPPPGLEASGRGDLRTPAPLPDGGPRRRGRGRAAAVRDPRPPRWARPRLGTRTRSTAESARLSGRPRGAARRPRPTGAQTRRRLRGAPAPARPGAETCRPSRST